GFDGKERGNGGRERRLFRVKVIHEDFIQSEVAGEREPVVGGWENEVSVRPGLAFAVDARTFVLNNGGRRAKCAIFPDRQSCYTSAAIVGHEDAMAGFFHGQMAWTIATR